MSLSCSFSVKPSKYTVAPIGLLYTARFLVHCSKHFAPTQEVLYFCRHKDMSRNAHEESDSFTIYKLHVPCNKIDFPLEQQMDID